MKTTVLGWMLCAVMVAALLPMNAAAQTAPSAVISFTAPTKRTDGSTPTGALSYRVYQGLKNAGKAAVATINGTSTTITTGLIGGNEYCWQVTAIEGGATESAMSNEACKVFPVAPLNAVTITVL